MSTATLSSKGQVTIPTDVRRRLGLESGDRVEFVEFDGGFAIIQTLILQSNDFRFAAVAHFFFQSVARVNNYRRKFADVFIINGRMFGADDDAIG